jgi:SOS response regulatory protein OraA/RecX
VPPAIIGALRDDDAGLEGPVSEDDRADAALERHLKGRPLPDDPNALQRLGMYLVRRGFSPETARAALRRHRASG